MDKKKKKPGLKAVLYSLFFLGWRGKFFSLLIAVLVYMYYQSIIQVDISFTMPIQSNGASDAAVQFLDKHEAVLHLSGRSDDLENLRSSDFEVYVQLDPSKSKAQEVPVQFRLRNTALQLSGELKMDVEPSSTRVLVERRSSKTLPVKVSLAGYPETGYILGSYQVSPESVSVIGPQSVLRGLDFVSTQTIDITGRNASFGELARLQFIAGLSAEEKASLQMTVSEVQVDIQINAKRETQTLSIRPRLVDLPDGLELLNIVPESVQLTLQGNSELLEQLLLGEQALQVELDGGDIFASGRYSLPVLIRSLPEGVSLLGSIPDRVSVVVGNR